ncbi:unnamed protein product [Brassica napus]|uniref:(rape) hypothetical protein n=1 Tax=Brassica napus TaxID=3708 RepID=A0A816NNP1_BRANA|nr:unnamed protein product [Brassica napus]
MENTQEYSPPHMDASRPSLGFPLGTALLLIIIFSLSGIFSCCYHWDKHRSLRRSLANASGHPSAASADIESSPFKPRLPFPVSSPLPILESFILSEKYYIIQSINYDFTSKKKQSYQAISLVYLSVVMEGYKKQLWLNSCLFY